MIWIAIPDEISSLALHWSFGTLNDLCYGCIGGPATDGCRPACLIKDVVHNYWELLRGLANRKVWVRDPRYLRDHISS